MMKDKTKKKTIRKTSKKYPKSTRLSKLTRDLRYKINITLKKKKSKINHKTLGSIT